MTIKQQARELNLAYHFPGEAERKAHEQEEIRSTVAQKKVIAWAILSLLGMVIFGIIVAVSPKIQERIDHWRQAHTWELQHPKGGWFK